MFPVVNLLTKNYAFLENDGSLSENGIRLAPGFRRKRADCLCFLLLRKMSVYCDTVLRERWI